jgi:hypothetical protein
MTGLFKICLRSEKCLELAFGSNPDNSRTFTAALGKDTVAFLQRNTSARKQCPGVFFAVPESSYIFPALEEITPWCPCSNLHKAEKDWRFARAGRTVTVMVAILCALVSIFEFHVRSRASLELELIALRHQVTILRRQRRGRPQFSSLDRLLWVWLYRILATGHRRDGLGQAGNCGPMASQGLPALLALAITPSGTTQDRPRNP